MKAFNQLKYLLLAVIMCTPLMLTGCKTPSKVKDPTTDPFATDPTAPAVSANYATAEQMQHVTGEKVASAGGSVTAHPGGRITYKLHITNNNNVPITVKVTDTLPIGTVLVSGCDNATGSNLSWEVNHIAAGATHTITYTVKPNYTVQQVRESKTDIILKNTAAKVMDKTIAAPAKDIWVLPTFNETDCYRMKMAINALVTANLTAKNSSNQPFCQLSLISAMYSVGFSSSTGFGTSDPDQVLANAFSGTFKHVAPTLYGGSKSPTSADKFFRGERATSVSTADLITGDVIIVNKSGDTKVYIYDGTYLVETSATAVTTNIDPTSVLKSLPSSDVYLVARNSFCISTSFSLENDEYYNDYDKQEYTALEKALIATAEAYLLRGDRSQYDDYRMSTSTYRLESLVRQPEDYTVDQYGYLDCSHFTYDVHWATYGYAAKAVNSIGSTVSYATCKNMLDCIQNGWNKNTLTGTNKSAVYFYQNTGKETDAEKEAIYQEFVSRLRPGDIVTYRYAGESGGHAMLYIGRGLLIHCTGSTYSKTNKTDTHEAGIRYMNVDDLFDSYVNSKRNMFGHSRFGIVRPQNLTTPNITENTANRVANMQGVVAEKVSSTAMGKTVNPGDTITYAFYIFNTTESNKQIDINDVLSEHVTFISASDGGTCAGSNVSWKLTVPANTRISVSYTVKVNDGVATYTAIDGSQATVNGVVHKCLDTYIANTLTEQQQQALVSAVSTVKGMNISDLNVVQVANLIYKTAFGVDNIFGDQVDTFSKLLGDLTGSVGNSLHNVGVFNLSSNGCAAIMDSNPSNGARMVAPGMYGGYNVDNSSKAGETYTRYLNLVDKPLRSRYYWEKDLVVGDIYFLQSSSSTNVFMYIGNNTLVSLSSLNEFSATVRLQYAHDRSTYLYHAVLRPSIVLDI